MKRIFPAILALILPLAAQEAGGRKHFLGVARPLTEASNRTPREIGQNYLADVAPQLGLGAPDLAGVFVAKEYQTAHNGVTHLIYRQRFQGIEVWNAEWVVNVDREGRVLNAGGRLFTAPPSGMTLAGMGTSIAAVRAAVRAVNPKLGRSYVPLSSQKAPARKDGVRFAAGSLGDDVEGQLAWYGVEGTLVPAWVFAVLDADGVNGWMVAVDADTQSVLWKRATTYSQSPATPQGLVYANGSPQPNPTPGVKLTAAPATVDRVQVPLAGDPASSPLGWVSGTETAGNNVVAGENLLGIRFLETPKTAQAADGNFSFPLQLGPEAPNPLAFSDAVTVNLFYWMNRAHDWFYQYGFDEAAGNFEQNNFGKGGVGGDPMYVYSHFGAASPSTAQISNAFYTSNGFQEDGRPAMVAMFVSTSGKGGFFTDGALDPQVMVHEYTHGVSTRLARQVYYTFQGAAMGEAWSDFYSLEFTLPEGAPVDGVYPVGEYFDQLWGSGIRTRPYSTDMDVDPLTFADLGFVASYPEVHADGEIWFEALWEVRANLIRQFGEAEGRQRVRFLVLDGMKLAPPQASMVDMRDAILLADRVDYDGASQDQIWAAFAKRGLGALAYSGSGDSLHIAASFDTPSSTGKLGFVDNPIVVGEPVRVILADTDYTESSVTIRLTGTSGDVEDLVLARTGSVYTGTIPTSGNVVARFNGTLNLIPGDPVTAFYLDENTPDGAALIHSFINTMQPYAVSGSSPSFSFGSEKPLGVVDGYGTRVSLPFAFPFHSKKYTSVLVDPNGLLSFDLMAQTACTDVAALRTVNGIAPLWTQLTVLGYTQPGEDVYLSQPTPQSVTFRWAAETYTAFSPSLPGDPVNFAVTLVNDGTILFNYGSNTNVGSAMTVSGCGPGPTIGISNGHELFAQAVLLTTVDHGVTVKWEPPYGFSSFPVAKVEKPVSGDKVQSVLTVSGVAYDPNSAISRVDVVVDDVERAVVRQMSPRPDFCSGQSVHGCPNVGFSVNLDVNAMGLAPGDHKLVVRVTNTRGALLDFPDTPVVFTVDAGAARLPAGKIETPAEGAELSGTVQVRGYAYAPDLRVTRVDTLIDGLTYGPTVYGLRRDDICGSLTAPKPPNCPSVGFTLSLNTRTGTPPLPDGPHSMQIRVQDETGRYTLIPDQPVQFTVKNGPYQPPAGVLLTPQPNDHLTGTVKVTGYAWSPGGKITGVYVLVDGVSVRAAHYGDPQPDACANLPDVTACPNIGFSADLDTTGFVSGPHVLGIGLRNGRGDTVIIPATLSTGINVFFDN